MDEAGVAELTILDGGGSCGLTVLFLLCTGLKFCMVGGQEKGTQETLASV